MSQYYSTKEVLARLGMTSQTKINYWLDTFGLSPYYAFDLGGLQYRYTEDMVRALEYVQQRRSERVKLSDIAEELQANFPGVFFPGDQQVMIPGQEDLDVPPPKPKVRAMEPAEVQVMPAQTPMRVMQVTRETAIGIAEDVLEEMASQMLPRLAQPLLMQLAELHTLLKTQEGQETRMVEALSRRFNGLEGGIRGLVDHLKEQDDRIVALERLLKTTSQEQAVQVQVVSETLQQSLKQTEDSQRVVSRWVQAMAKTWVGKRLGFDRLASYGTDTEVKRDSASET